MFYLRSLVRRLLDLAGDPWVRQRHRTIPLRPTPVPLEERALLAATITDLGTLTGGHQSYALDINNAGQVVGESEVAVGSQLNQHAFMYQDSVITDLGTLPGLDYSSASSINASGQVVGHSENNNNAGERAVLFDNGAVNDLGILPNFSISLAVGINDAGQIAGSCNNSAGLPHGALFGGDSPTDLGAFGGNAAQPTSINNAGQITAYGYGTTFAPTTFQAALYSVDAGTALDLGSLAGPAGYSAASDINDSGYVVGTSATTTGSYHAFLYNGGVSSSDMLDLGTLPGEKQSSANGINNSGLIVGSSYNTSPSEDGRAFIYSNARMLDLNSFLPANSGWTLIEATAINDKGQIVGYGYHNNKNYLHAFLLDFASPTSTPPGQTPPGQPSPPGQPQPPGRPSPGQPQSPGQPSMPGQPQPPEPPGATLPVLHTGTVLTVKPRSSRFGRPVTLTASVNNRSHVRGIPTGSVAFMEGEAMLGTAGLRHGKARLRTTNLPMGPNPIQAVYEGSPGFSPSTSAVVVQTVRVGRSGSKTIASHDLPRIEPGVPLSVALDQIERCVGMLPSSRRLTDDPILLGTVPVTEDLIPSGVDNLLHDGHLPQLRSHLVRPRRPKWGLRE